MAYEDTSGQKGVVEATGLEWMRAGSGTWHQGFIHPRGATTTAFQLWVALPQGVEDGPPEGIYVAPREVPQVGNVPDPPGRRRRPEQPDSTEARAGIEAADEYFKSLAVTPQTITRIPGNSERWTRH